MKLPLITYVPADVIVSVPGELVHLRKRQYFLCTFRRWVRWGKLFVITCVPVDVAAIAHVLGQVWLKVLLSVYFQN